MHVCVHVLLSTFVPQVYCIMLCIYKLELDGFVILCLLLRKAVDGSVDLAYKGNSDSSNCRIIKHYL